MASEILRGDIEIAINDLAVACREAAAAYQAAAEQDGDPAITHQLRNLALTRDRSSASLADYLVEHFDGPNWPAEERELIAQAALRLKSALGADEPASLLADCRAAEVRVRDAASAALDQPLSDAVHGDIAALAEDAGARIDWLDGYVESAPD